MNEVFVEEGVRGRVLRKLVGIDVTIIGTAVLICLFGVDVVNELNELGPHTVRSKCTHHMAREVEIPKTFRHQEIV